MATPVTINGYTFREDTGGGVSVSGPGISNGSFGTQVSNSVATFSINDLLSLNSVPGVNRVAYNILIRFTAQDIGDIKAGLTGPSQTEPVPPSTENKTSPNNLTGEADGESGENKESQAEANPNPSGNLPNSSVAPDSPKSAQVATQQAAPASQKPGMRPQNPLGSLSSYTYQLTLYMITPDAYDAFIQSGRSNINAINNAANPQVATDVENSMSGAYIIAQSGGINRKTSKRAFDYDFYIDDLTIKTKTAGPATSTASNDSEISFNIYEPYGFSFISKITNASQILRTKSKLKNYTDLSNAGRQFFILGVRFQGYDEAGKEISADTTFNQDTKNITGDSGGVYERFFDIKIKSFKFKLDGKMTVYSLTAAPIAPNTAFGVKFGRLDHGGRYKGTTVSEVLQNLIDQLNQNQQNRKNTRSTSIEGIIPNVYNKIRYLGNSEKEIGDATIVSVADVSKFTWPMSVAKNIAQVNEGVSVTATPNSNSRTITFANDISIMQAVSSIISQSSYLTDALNVVIKSTTQPVPADKGGPDVPDSKPDSIKWYNLGAEVKCIGFDTVLGDFAYEITYVIQPYETPYVTTPYVNNTTKYYGPYKRYEYWFTGKNSEIINYEQKLDNAYFIAANNPTGAPASQGGGQDIPASEGKRQNEDRTGKLDQGKEAQNSYLTSLFDPGSYANAKVTIMGDPDFLMQESPSSINQVYRQFYGKGFTINPNGGQVFIEIDFKEAEDYNNDTGLLTINQSILFWKYPKEVASIVKGISYQVIEVNSSFSKGKFIQELGCVINPMTDVVAKEATNSAGRPVALDASGRQTGASDARVAPTITEEDKALAASEVNRLATKYPVKTNSALNASSENKDDNIVTPTKQPANQGGREVNLSQANQALANRARDNATTNDQLRLLGRRGGGG